MDSNRIVIKASSDTYYDDEEPTIPSMRPQAIADRERPSSFTQLQILALAGLISATLVVVGGVFDSTIVIGLSGVLMVIGNIQAAVRR